MRGRGGGSETPPTRLNHCVRDNSNEGQPIGKEQGPGGGRGAGMPHEQCLAVTRPQDEPSREGGRGRDNTRSTRKGDRGEITVFRRCRL